MCFTPYYCRVCVQLFIVPGFSKKNAAELDSRHEELLKDELKERINQVLRSGKIEEIWFLELNVIPL